MRYSLDDITLKIKTDLVRTQLLALHGLLGQIVNFVREKPEGKRYALTCIKNSVGEHVLELHEKEAGKGVSAAPPALLKLLKSEPAVPASS